MGHVKERERCAHICANQIAHASPWPHQAPVQLLRGLCEGVKGEKGGENRSWNSDYSDSQL